MQSSGAALGFTVKSGWAAAVLVSGTPVEPRVDDSRTIDLSDPNVPLSRQPHHDGYATARKPGAELTRLLALIERHGSESVGAAVAAYRDAGHHLRGAALVVGSTIEPENIANEHIRIHALEGRLFRRVVEDELRRRGVDCHIWRERDLYSQASQALKQSEAGLRTALAELRPPGRVKWRAEQKAAALAAWVVLFNSARELR